jgi:uncharacterized protein
MKEPEFLIEKYHLQPHPEGGYFCEVYRSEQKLLSPVANEKRNTISHIYFLLKQGQFSRFHKVLHDEIWNFYGGSPLRVIEFDGVNIKEKVIGKENESYFSVVKGGVFQAAESTGEFSFVGCSVAPGFDFKDFSFINDEPEVLHELKRNHSNYDYLI